MGRFEVTEGLNHFGLEQVAWSLEQAAWSRRLGAGVLGAGGRSSSRHASIDCFAEVNLHPGHSPDDQCPHLAGGINIIRTLLQLIRQHVHSLRFMFGRQQAK